MWTRTRHPGIVVALLGLTVIGGASEPRVSPAPVEPPDHRTAVVRHGPRGDLGADGFRVRVRGGTTRQWQRLELALGRFEAAGLVVPSLEVVFAADARACGGHRGLFSASGTPWTIVICSDVDSVYEHELAHAWLRAEFDARERRDFVEAAGYPAWGGVDVPWNRRGGEQAAIAIQTGIAGLPLPPALGRGHLRRLEAFEVLTGRPAPRLAEWLSSRRIACSDRPTAMSAWLPDITGSRCRPAPHPE